MQPCILMNKKQEDSDMEETYQKYIERFWNKLSPQEIEEKGIREIFDACIESSNCFSDPVGKKNNLNVIIFFEGRRVLKESLELIERKAIFDTKDEVKIHVCEAVCFLMHLKGLKDNYIKQIRTGIERLLKE